MTDEWLEHDVVWYVEKYDLETESWVRVNVPFAFKEKADKFFDLRAQKMPGAIMRMVQEVATVKVVRQRGAPQWTRRNR